MTTLTGLAFVYVFSLTALIAWALCPLCARIARRTGFLDQPGARKIHSEPKPYLGGAAIFWSFNLVILAHVLLVYLAPRSGPALFQPGLDFIATHRDGIVRKLPQLFAFLGGGLIVHLIGLYDDRFSMSPRRKLLGIVLAALILITFGISLSAFVEHRWTTYALTVFWVVLISNSFNLLDNMDGLSAGVAAICLGFFAFISIRMGQIFVPLTIIALIGALLGFLWHNFNPSRIFMGDAGSLFVGYAVSGLTILSTFWAEEKALTPASIAIPILVMGVPLFDTISVIAIRLRNRKPLFVGDKNHFSHRMVALGLSTRDAVLFIYLVTFVTGVSATLLIYMSDLAGTVLVAVQALAYFAIIALLEYVSRQPRKRP